MYHWPRRTPTTLPRRPAHDDHLEISTDLHPHAHPHLHRDHGYYGPASAAETSQNQTAESSYQELSRTEAAGHLDTLKTQVSSGDTITVHTDTQNLEWDKASVGVLGENTIVTVPLANEGTQWSNLTAVYNPNGDLQTFSEGHFTAHTASSGHAVIYSNGTKVTDKDVAAPDVAVAVGVGDAISELNSCLSAAGIPAWVVAAATAACSTTGWVGIAACYTAAGVGGGTVGYCVGKASQKL